MVTQNELITMMREIAKENNTELILKEDNILSVIYFENDTIREELIYKIGDKENNTLIRLIYTKDKSTGKWTRYEKEILTISRNCTSCLYLLNCISALATYYRELDNIIPGRSTTIDATWLHKTMLTLEFTDTVKCFTVKINRLTDEFVVGEVDYGQVSGVFENFDSIEGTINYIIENKTKEPEIKW